MTAMSALILIFAIISFFITVSLITDKLGMYRSISPGAPKFSIDRLGLIALWAIGTFLWFSLLFHKIWIPL